MSDWWLAFLYGFVPAALTAALGWLKWWHELREKRHEKAGREKAEGELLLIRRRGNAPFLAPDPRTFGYLYLPAETPGSYPFVAGGSPELLCFTRSEVDRVGMKPGSDVLFVIQNKGEDADRIKVSLDGKRIRLRQEPDLDSARGLDFISYEYIPELHGREQVIEVWFQARSGFEDTHKYRTRHGMRILERTDPP